MNKSVVRSIQNQNILVLGLAKSGVAVAKLLLRYGAKVTVNEYKPRERCPEADELEALGIPVICGGHPLHLLDRSLDRIIKNPGIPFDIPFLQEAEKRGIPVITEVEIAFQFARCPIIAITGSNGKTTTTTLVYEMLKTSERYRRPLIAGNIGTVLCEVAERAKEDEVIVAELSSFQLLGTETFRPVISCLINLFDAHLNYHHTREHYVQSKAKIFANQQAGDLAVINDDQEAVRKLAKSIGAKVVRFSTEHPVSRGAYIENGLICYRNGGRKVELIPLADLRLVGKHNVQNALAAATIAMEAGAMPDRVREVFRTFSGVPHRLQFVTERNGVRFFNDSKATNVLATIMALQCFNSPVHLIAGGMDRGEDLTSLRGEFERIVKSITVYGQTAQSLTDVARSSGVKEIRSVDNVKDAVDAAAALAQEGEVVLLSPAAASWDQFQSFEERGDMFIQSVHKLR